MTQQEIQSFFAPPNIMQCKKVLCVQPHPDDNEIGMGGIISKLAKNGCEVHYLTITDGSLGAHSEMLMGEALSAVRKEELKLSGELLGVKKFHNFNLEDGTLCSNPELTSMIAELMREECYDAVCCPDPWLAYEAHQDHIATGKAVAQAFISCDLQEYPKGTKTKGYTPVAIGFYFTKNPNTIVDITEEFQQKMVAVSLHKSQINDQLLELYTAYFGMRGQAMAQDKSFQLGEGLKVLSPIHLHCFPEGGDI